MSSQKPSTKASLRSEREERLAAQLRENLKRRKAQARARNSGGGGASGGDGGTAPHSAPSDETS